MTACWGGDVNGDMQQESKKQKKSRHNFPATGEDGLPIFEVLGEPQIGAIAATYAALLADLASEHALAVGFERDALELILGRLRHDALWAVTEVRSAAEFKYLRQRYISQGVFIRWKALAAGKKKEWGAYSVDDDGKSLRHEHVFPRAGLRARIEALSCPMELQKVLLSSASCIVTFAEDCRLERSNGIEGWARYVGARGGPIGVYDCYKRAWLIPPAPSYGEVADATAKRIEHA